MENPRRLTYNVGALMNRLLISLSLAGASLCAYACSGEETCQALRNCPQGTSGSSGGGTAGEGGMGGSGAVAASGGGGGSPDAGKPCTEDDECDDKLWCNGVEKCVGKRCRAGSPAQCMNPAADHCSADCTETSSGPKCVVGPLDFDGDQQFDALCPTDPGTDCNDRNDKVFAGAQEGCDGYDSDCDGLSDLQDGWSLAGAVQDVDSTSTLAPVFVGVRGTDRFVALSSESTLTAQAFSKTAAPLGGPVTVFNGAVDAQAAAVSDSALLVAWKLSTNAVQVRSYSLDLTGPSAVQPFSADGGVPALVGDGAQWHAAQARGGDVYYVPVAASATPGTPLAVGTYSGAEPLPAMAKLGSSIAIGWSDATEMKRVLVTGTQTMALDPWPVDGTDPAPMFASLGDRVWAADRASGDQLDVGVFGADGTLLCEQRDALTTTMKVYRVQPTHTEGLLVLGVSGSTLYMQRFDECDADGPPQALSTVVKATGAGDVVVGFGKNDWGLMAGFIRNPVGLTARPLGKFLCKLD